MEMAHQERPGHGDGAPGYQRTHKRVVPARGRCSSKRRNHLLTAAQSAADVLQDLGAALDAGPRNRLRGPQADAFHEVGVDALQKRRRQGLFAIDLDALQDPSGVRNQTLHVAARLADRHAHAVEPVFVQRGVLEPQQPHDLGRRQVQNEVAAFGLGQHGDVVGGKPLVALELLEQLREPPRQRVPAPQAGSGPIERVGAQRLLVPDDRTTLATAQPVDLTPIVLDHLQGNAKLARKRLGSLGLLNDQRQHAFKQIVALRPVLHRHATPSRYLPPLLALSCAMEKAAASAAGVTV